MILRYKCENDDCPAKDEEVEVPPGEDAECESCGWFMVGVW